MQGDGMKAANIARVVSVCALALLVGAPTALLAAEEKGKGGGGLVECKMTYSLSGWSVFYKTATGSGTITCNNGQHAKVKVRAKGGGITFGRSEVVNGSGNFTGARNISELFGSYAQAEAHAGAGKSVDAQALTKGSVSLTLAGKGRGIDIGFAFGKFTIDRAK
jgi:hypothetical protein